MANIVFKGHKTRGKELYKLLKLLGGMDSGYSQCSFANCYYYINREGYIESSIEIPLYMDKHVIMTLEKFEKKYPYKVGDKVIYVKYNDGYPIVYTIQRLRWTGVTIEYLLDSSGFSALTKDLQPYKEETMEDKGNISDGYHTFNELYEYRLLYNASMFNEFAKQGLYDVHKSKRHSDGTIPFGDENWFIVQAELPTGQISNHYEMKDWELFNVPEKEKANHYDGHTPQDVAKRLRIFLTPKPKYPKTYEECCNALQMPKGESYINIDVPISYNKVLTSFTQLLICRDAYWEIAGNWKPNFANYEEKFVISYVYGNVYTTVATNYNRVLVFPTEEMRDAFYENFNELIEECKELL